MASCTLATIKSMLAADRTVKLHFEFRMPKCTHCMGLRTWSGGHSCFFVAGHQRDQDCYRRSHWQSCTRYTHCVWCGCLMQREHLTGWYCGIVIVVHVVMYLFIEQLCTWQVPTLAFQHLVSSFACTGANVCVCVCVLSLIHI